MAEQRFTFPRWTNLALPVLGIVGATAPLYVALVVAYGFSPQAIDVGYRPEQPIPFSHQLHAGELGVDCRYCHNTVEYTAHAAIPPTQTCMNCHSPLPVLGWKEWISLINLYKHRFKSRGHLHETCNDHGWWKRHSTLADEPRQNTQAIDSSF